MKFENVSLLEVSDDKDTIQFRTGDIVEIIYKINKKCVGVIKFVDTNFLEIDASGLYKSNIKEINYSDIDSIKLIEGDKQ